MPDLNVDARLTARDTGTSVDRPIEVGTAGDFAVERTGAATQFTLAEVLQKLGNILTELQATLDVVGTVAISNFPASQAVTAGALPLPAGAATEATQQNRYAGGKLAATATVTATGDTTIITPAAGKKVRVFWVTAINDPDQSQTPLIAFKFGAAEFYRAYAVAHWEIFEGVINQPLVVSLDQTGSVAVTVHYQEL